MTNGWRALVVVGALAGCAPALAPPPQRGAPPGFSDVPYRQAAASGEPVFRVDPQRSQALVYVYRGGPLARLGHDHVVVSRDLNGYVRLPEELGYAQADLYLSLERLAVDEPALRAEAGFDTQPSAADIAGTRHNMLERVLAAARHPFAAARLRYAEGTPPAVVLHAEITLHGVTRAVLIPAELDTAGGELRARARFALRQSDFGITPLSVLGGALTVQDRVELRLEIYAPRWQPAPTAPAR